MKKCFLALLMSLLMLLSACGAPADTETESQKQSESDTLQATESESETTALCDHAEMTDSDYVAPMPLVDGSVTHTCNSCGHTETETIPATKTLKVLSIGNSFSGDANAYLKDLMIAAGMKSFVIGHASIGGCSIDEHWENALSGEKAYGYSEKTKSADKSGKSSLENAIKAAAWDIIILQQVSNTSGVPSTYSNLENLIGFVKEKATNPNVKIMFHMTWAYQNGFKKTAFAEYYNNDQLTMYQAIIEAMKSEVLTKNEIVDLIPSGTSIQNLRTSYVGDTLTRDGTHMSYDIGRYTVALTWLTKLTGADITKIKWVPEEYPAVTADILVIREAILNAIANPLTITESKTPILE